MAASTNATCQLPALETKDQQQLLQQVTVYVLLDIKCIILETFFRANLSAWY